MVMNDGVDIVRMLDTKTRLSIHFFSLYNIPVFQYTVETRDSVSRNSGFFRDSGQNCADRIFIY